MAHPHRKEVAVLAKLGAKLIEKLGEAMSVDYALYVVDHPEDLSAHSPETAIVPLTAIEPPFHDWLERMRFFSGEAHILLVGDPDALPEGFLASARQGQCSIIPTAWVANGLFLPGLFQACQMREQRNQIADLHRHERSDQDLHRELDFRSQVLRWEKDFTANIISSITSGLMISDLEGNLVMVNDETKRIFGIGPKDYLAVHYREIFEAPAVLAMEEFSAAALRSRARVVSERSFGEDLIVSWKCYPVVNQAGEIQGTLHLIDDITKQELTERQLVQAEKLATMGTMLSGVAHELRNPLAIMSGRCQRLLSKKDNFDEWTVHYLDSINEQTIRCGAIVNNLLSFSRRESAGYDYYGLGKILDEVLTYVDYQNFFDKIEVRKQFKDDPLIYCDRLQMVQVFLNLVVNAGDAMNGHGILTLTAQARGDTTVVGIHDTGEGIDPKNMKKIFDPFFTTKEAGKGTGLGLPIVYRIVQLHGGEIHVTSSPGNTLFEVILPTRKKDGLSDSSR